jgi:hypothetical protein
MNFFFNKNFRRNSKTGGFFFIVMHLFEVTVTYSDIINTQTFCTGMCADTGIIGPRMPYPRPATDSDSSQYEEMGTGTVPTQFFSNAQHYGIIWIPVRYHTS